MDDLETEEKSGPMKSLFSTKKNFLKHPIVLLILFIFVITIIISVYKKFKRTKNNIAQRTDNV